jgi:hypothetical protein
VDLFGVYENSSENILLGFTAVKAEYSWLHKNGNGGLLWT